MTSYYSQHSINLLSHKDTHDKNNEKVDTKSLKEKISVLDKNNKQKTKLFKIKLTMLLILSHIFIFLLTKSIYDNNLPVKERSNAQDNKLIRTIPNKDEVLLNANVVLLTSFQKNEKAKQVDLYWPNGKIYLKNIIILSPDSSNLSNDIDEIESLNNKGPRSYDFIVQKINATKFLKIVSKNLHALPHNLDINEPQKNLPLKGGFKKLTDDPYKKPWSQK